MTLEGALGAFSLIDGGGANLDISLDAATKFYQELTIKKEDIASNRFGIYSFLPVGRDGKAKLVEMTALRHLLQGRNNCKTWAPKGQSGTNPRFVSTMGVEYNGEQCGDAFLGDQFEKLLAVGADKTDLTASAEGRELLSMIVENVYRGLNNSFHDMVWYSRHAQIASANSSTTYDTSTVTASEWADYYGQQFAEDESGRQMKGFSTLIDEEKAAGTAHFNLGFTASEFDDTTGAYSGSDITAEFDAVIRAAHGNFKPLVRSRRSDVGVVFMVSLSVFDAYKKHLIATHGQLSEGYALKIDGEFVRGVLFYDGIPVVAMDEWGQFDDMLNIHTHRIVLTATGNLGIAHSVDPIAQGSGLGLRIQKSPLMRDKGRIDMFTSLRIGTVIADTTLMVNKSLVEARP